MNYVRIEDGCLLVKPLSKGASPEAAKKYIAAVRSELQTAMDGMGNGLHRVELEDESRRRGGSFPNSSVAVSEMLSEVVDLARSANRPVR